MLRLNLKLIWPIFQEKYFQLSTKIRRSVSSGWGCHRQLHVFCFISSSSSGGVQAATHENEDTETTAVDTLDQQLGANFQQFSLFEHRPLKTNTTSLFE